MTRASVQLAAWMQTRICPRCGHEDARMREGAERALFECPGCGQDLYARPPVSYASMEGLDDSPRSARLGDRAALDAETSRLIVAAVVGRRSRARGVRGWLRRLWARLTTRRYC